MLGEHPKWRWRTKVKQKCQNKTKATESEQWKFVSKSEEVSDQSE